MILAIDFDETIHAKSQPITGRQMGAPLEGAKEALELFKRRGDEVIICTVMARLESGRQVVEDWMHYYHIPFDMVTSVKPNADVFIDDKAIRHVNWSDTLEKLHEIRTFKNQTR